jgi:hypothetical protein
MHTSQGSKASWLRQVCQRTEEVSDLRDIHKVGWPLVPMLRLQAQNKATELEVQGKAQGQDRWQYRSTTACTDGKTEVK